MPVAQAKIDRCLLYARSHTDYQAQIMELAARFYEDDPEDFGIQSLMSDQRIIFGFKNRIEWTAMHGFRIVCSECTIPFIRHFEAIKKGS